MSTLGITFSSSHLLLGDFLGAAHFHVAVFHSGYAALQNQQLLFAVDFQNFQIANRDLLVSHLSGHALSLKDARWKRRRTDRTRRAMEHGTVAAFAALEVMAFHESLPTAADAGGDHVYFVAGLEDILDGETLPDGDIGAR